MTNSRLFILFYFLSLGLIVGYPLDAAAMNNVATHQIISHPSKTDTLHPQKQHYIKGKILNVKNNKPLAGVTLFVNGQFIALTNSTGVFNIEVPDSLLQKKIVLTSSYIGYKPIHDTLTNDLPIHKNYYLKESHQVIIQGHARKHKSIIVCTISREQWILKRYSLNQVRH